MAKAWLGFCIIKNVNIRKDCGFNPFQIPK